MHRSIRATSTGRSVESLGPLVLGLRLNSSRADGDAFSAIVYMKGAMVLELLGRYFKDASALPRLLRGILASGSGQEIDTAGFFAALERMANIDLDWVRRTYIYGTGIPEVHYTYAFEKTPGGKWKVSGEARQVSSFRFHHRIVKYEDGTPDVAREMIPEMTNGVPLLVTPFQVRLKEAPRSARERVSKGSDQIVGRVRIQGTVTPFSIEIDEEPERFWLDQRQEVLASFFCDTRSSKLAFMNHGFHMLAADSLDEAEAAYRSGLSAVLEPAAAEDGSDDPSWSEQKRRDEFDALIHMGLAEIALERRQPDVAEEEVRVARKLLTVNREIRYEETLRRHLARADVQRGRYREAFEHLRRDYGRRPQGDNVEGFLLAAIAARALGEAEAFEWSMTMARQRGADVRLLEKTGN